MWFAQCVLVLLLTAAATGDIVHVFSKGESGYFCIKIPDLVVTRNHTLIALGEARMHSCSDYTWTDLVIKRSFDLGKTWTPLGVLFRNSSNTTTHVIGNAAPVVLPSGRILVPFCRDNLEVLLTYSDDDGATWSPPKVLSGVTLPSWKWIGTGPPAGLVLSNGRVLVPAYHSTAPHNTDGELSRSHAMLSDDQGVTWRLGGTFDGPHASNECQAVQLANGTVMINARTLGTERVTALSHDGGVTWSDPVVAPSLVEPLEGCEGSTIRHPTNDWLFFSIPNNRSVQRFNMTIWVSTDNARSWKTLKQVYAGRSGYSALAMLPDGTVGLLYEHAVNSGVVFVPEYISYTAVWS